MTARVGNTALTAATVALLLAAAAPWLLPIERWLPEPLPAMQGQARGLGAPLNRLITPPLRQIFAAVVERPLFNASRRAPSAAPLSVGGETMLLGRYRLSGVVVTAKLRLALLVDASGRHFKVEEGGDLDGWRMLSISPRHLVLSRAGERLAFALTPPPGAAGVPGD